MADWPHISRLIIIPNNLCFVNLTEVNWRAYANGHLFVTIKSIMPKNKKQKDSWWYWLTIGLIAYLIIAPNTTVIKLIVGQIEPIEFTFLRGAMIVIVSLPIVIASIRKFNRRNLTYSLAAGLCLAIATLSLAYAVKYSDASYTAVMGLISPLLLVVLSSRFMGDKISFRAAAGVALGAAGTLVIMLTPLLLSGQTTTHFYPLATSLMVINCVFFTLNILFARKANEAGMPLPANSGFAALIVTAVSFIGLYTVGDGSLANIGQLSFNTWIGLFYSGVVVVFLARIMNIASYEHIGAAATSGLNYLSTIVSVIIPVLILGEKLSSTLVFGGILIFIGVFLTEKHRAKHHHHLAHGHSSLGV